MPTPVTKEVSEGEDPLCRGPSGPTIYHPSPLIGLSASVQTRVRRGRAIAIAPELNGYPQPEIVAHVGFHSSTVSTPVQREKKKIKKQELTKEL